MMAEETSPFLGGSAAPAAGRSGPAKRSSTYRMHEQLDPVRSKPMQYGAKGSRRERVGLPPAADSMDLPTNASQTQRFGRPEELSSSQAASLLCKYIVALFTAVGLFLVVGLSVNNLVHSMMRRGISG
jgi:hypothetical protein